MTAELGPDSSTVGNLCESLIQAGAEGRAPLGRPHGGLHHPEHVQHLRKTSVLWGDGGVG